MNTSNEFNEFKVWNLDDHGFPNVQELVEVVEQIKTCSSHQFLHKTSLHCAVRKAIFFSDWIMQHLKL